MAAMIALTTTEVLGSDANTGHVQHCHICTATAVVFVIAAAGETALIMLCFCCCNCHACKLRLVTAALSHFA